MSSYNDLIKQIETLTKQAEDLRKSEILGVISEIKEKMAKHGITLADLRGEKTSDRAPKKTKSVRSKVAVKFRNPQTGEAWSGRGRTPKWLSKAESDGMSREHFAI